MRRLERAQPPVTFPAAMKKLLASLLLLSVVAPVLSACENTIRGVGRDTAQTVNATQNAARRTGRAVRN